MSIELLAIVPVVIVAFIATNLDNFMILVTLFARFRDRLLWVATAYLVCMALLIFVAWWVGDVADNIPVNYLGFLGIVPIVIGLSWLRRPGKITNADSTTALGDHFTTVFGVTLASQLSNGTDTILTFSVLFADSLPAVDGVIVVSMVVMSLLIALLAFYATLNRAFHEGIGRYAGRLAPFIMIGVGLYILANTTTDLLV
jgi:cadmium resistance protein CadD (predicted permease)